MPKLLRVEAHSLSQFLLVDICIFELTDGVVWNDGHHGALRGMPGLLSGEVAFCDQRMDG